MRLSKKQNEYIVNASMGVMSLVEYRMKWYNEDEATAKSKIPEQNQVME